MTVVISKKNRKVGAVAIIFATAGLISLSLVSSQTSITVSIMYVLLFYTLSALAIAYFVSFLIYIVTDSRAK